MTTPRVLIVAGSDSGGGAGIQADIKTVTMLGGHAMTAVTALTAQNTLGVQGVMPVPAGFVVEQMRSVLGDIGADAVKIGMIGSAATAHAVADVLEGLDAPIVFDPVMVATSGSVLADAETVAAFGRLMRLASVVTPNLPELEALGGEAAVLAHAPAVLVKGGHAEGEVVIDRLVARDGEVRRWEAPRIDTAASHGTGCTLASAVATYLARGASLAEAVARARQFVRMAMRDAPGFGRGAGPMAQQAVRLDLGAGPRLNQVTLPADEFATSCDFYRLLGLKQIVGSEDAYFYGRFEAPCGTTLSVEQGAKPAVYIEHEYLDAEIARLQAEGVTFESPPEEKPWLWREAWLTDPAGNRVCLYQADENRRFPPWRMG